MMDLFKEILEKYNLEFKKDHPEIEINGSPERCQQRWVIEDQVGDFFIVEKIFNHQVNRREYISQNLEKLNQAGLDKIELYLTNNQNEFITQINKDWWQIKKYILGVDLQRPDYLDDSWRGQVLADWYLEFSQNSSKLNTIPQAVFSIKTYIYELIEGLKKYQPKVLNQIEPVLNFLNQKFMLQHDKLTKSFCHGDWHVLNIIWGEQEIKKVIDWEFCGWKPQVYDLANMLGCLGVEHPTAFQRKCVLSLIQKIKGSNLFNKLSWQILPEFILALRFAWLAEWLRKNDQPMIKLEIDYMFWLKANVDKLID
ncbi:MAG: aminoglycoside phosphotransferase family protein [Patescibacteria group bacterium]|nr:aminoglycoside phosphotransferase family protein [Patescibacteria group bacterium]